jgi:hypothetical protein
MKLGVAEIFAKIDAAESTDERVAILRKHGTEINNTALATILRYTLEPQPWHPDLPKGKVKFTPSGYLDQQMMLPMTLRKIPRHFFEDSTPMPAEKRINLWVQFLEGLDKDDARVMECVRTRTTLPYKSITRKLVKEAFPGFLGEETK